MNFATPSITYPAMNVAMSEATKDETFVAPTAATEKLYGGAEKICESVIEIKTNQEIQIVNRSVAHRTIGDASTKNGSKKVRQKETESQYPDHGMSSFMYDMRGSVAEGGWARCSSTCSTVLSFSETPRSTVLSVVSMWRAPFRWYADSGMKKSTRRVIRTKAPPIACIVTRYELACMIDPAIGPARFWDC